MEAIDNIMELITANVGVLDLNGASETTLLLTENSFKAARYENLLFMEGNKIFLDLGYFPEIQKLGVEKVIIINIPNQ